MFSLYSLMCTHTRYYYYLYLNYIIRHGPHAFAVHKNTFHIWNLNFQKKIDVTTRDRKCAIKCIISGLLLVLA